MLRFGWFATFSACRTCSRRNRFPGDSLCGPTASYPPSCSRRMHCLNVQWKCYWRLVFSKRLRLYNQWTRRDHFHLPTGFWDTIFPTTLSSCIVCAFVLVGFRRGVKCLHCITILAHWCWMCMYVVRLNGNISTISRTGKNVSIEATVLGRVATCACRHRINIAQAQPKTNITQQLALGCTECSDDIALYVLHFNTFSVFTTRVNIKLISASWTKIYMWKSMQHFIIFYDKLQFVLSVGVWEVSQPIITKYQISEIPPNS